MFTPPIVYQTGTHHKRCKLSMHHSRHQESLPKGKIRKDPRLKSAGKVEGRVLERPKILLATHPRRLRRRPKTVPVGQCLLRTDPHQLQPQPTTKVRTKRYQKSALVQPLQFTNILQYSTIDRSVLETGHFWKNSKSRKTLKALMLGIKNNHVQGP